MNITLVGPRSVGKSTISKLLARKLKYRYVEIDALTEVMLKKYGGLDTAIKAGKIGVVAKKSPKMLSKVLASEKVLLDLAGGAISSRKYKKACKENIKIIKEKSYVIGLLPFKDKEKGVKLLYSRERHRKHFKGMDAKDLYKEVKKDYLKLVPILKRVSDLVYFVEQKKPEVIAKALAKKAEQITSKS